MTAAEQTIGVGTRLDHVRALEEIPSVGVVGFRNVTKTYNFGEPNAFTAIRDVDFVVEDLPDEGRVRRRSSARAAAARARSCA